MDEEKGEDISFSLGVDDEPRAGGEWSRSEMARTRSFLHSTPQPIGDGQIGSVGSIAFELACKRTAAGFEGSYSISIEERIGPRRADRGHTTGRWLASDNSVVLSFPMPEFGRTCGNHTHTWKGALTKDQFDRIAGFRTDGEVSTRRC